MRKFSARTAALAVGVALLTTIGMAPATVTANAASNDLIYGGGTSDGSAGTIGVETAPKVYLVFWGWDSTDNPAGDPTGEKTYLINFLNGLYTSGEHWHDSTLEFCQGVATGATTCPTSAAHVGSLTAPMLGAGTPPANVWEDNSPALSESYLPVTVHGVSNGIPGEAYKAAQHFGNNTVASNASAQYIIALPPKRWPVGFGDYYCAYHSWDSTAAGNVAFTVLPYMSDFGITCGGNSVNSGTPGTRDGISIVEGHEYAETVTDQFPSGGWLDSSGAENGDKCAWTGLHNITLPTGTFAVQPLWSNASHGCVG
jgi:serine protease